MSCAPAAGSTREPLPVNPPRPRRLMPRLAFAGFLLSLIGSTLGCGGGQPVTAETLEAARTLWKQAGITDYELEWTVTGPNNAHYFVTVEDSKVRKLELIQPNGERQRSAARSSLVSSVSTVCSSRWRMTWHSAGPQNRSAVLPIPRS